MKHSLIADSQYRLEAPDLQVVLALARGGTLAAAADRLAADVSTVFRSVQRIEKNLGQRLFERTRGEYVPTDAAQALCAHAERIESELEEARAAVLATAQEVSGRVRLSTVDTVLR